MRRPVAFLGLVVSLALAACGSGNPTTARPDFGPSDPDAPADPDTADAADPGPGFDYVGRPDVDCGEAHAQCRTIHSVESCVLGEWVVSAVCIAGDICLDGRCVPPQPCVPGAIGGCFAFDAQAVCNESGIAYVPRNCPDGTRCVMGGLCMPTVCTPTYGLCTGLTSFKTCLDDGSGYGPDQDCPESLQCMGGTCHSMCESELKIASYLGCEYWTVDLHNWDRKDIALSPPAEPIPHAVVVSNPGPEVAIVKFETPAAVTFAIPAADLTIPPGETRIYVLPVMNQNGTGRNNLSVRITATHPVSVHQFNPLNNVGVASNDASLLLPVNVLGQDYIAFSYPTGHVPQSDLMAEQTTSGYITVVAVKPGETRVDVVKATGAILGGGGVPSVPKNGSATYFLQQYEVLNLEAGYSGMIGFDLTGTVLHSSQPVAVFGGHECAVIGPDNKSCCCCDHLEEQMIPLYAWGRDYHAVLNKPRGGPESEDYWLVIAGEDDVTLHTDPPIPGLDGAVLKYQGWFKWVHTNRSFELSASGKVGVANYQLSQECMAQVIGDPSMTVIPTVEQYRKEYALLTPINYAENWVTLVRPANLPITLDGTAILQTFTPFGSGQFEYAYVPMEPGVHHLAAAQTFQVIAYGYDSAVSYGYPGGMNLLKKTGP